MLLLEGCSWRSYYIILTNVSSFTGARKKQLHVDKPDDDIVVDGYEALDDFDFM